MRLGLQAPIQPSTEWREAYLERWRRIEERERRLAPMREQDRRRLERCPLKGPRAGEPGRCGLCGEPLPVGRSGRPHPNRRWCSAACSDRYWSNHGWATASAAALKRDGWSCVRCGAFGRGSTAPPAELREQHGGWPATSLEVNHRIPRNGRGYHNGCHHHLEELETLCRPCHATETAKQARGRRLAGHLRILLGIRTGRLRVDPTQLRIRNPRTRSPEAAPIAIWPDL